MATVAHAKDNEEGTRPTNGACFVIMPFGGWADSYYQEIYRPAVIDAQLIPLRADDLFRPGTIIKDVWQLTKDARVLLADLTGRNPNVLYELGLAHAIAKPAVLVSESLDDIPFDLRALRVIEYDKNTPNWGELLRSKITRALQELLEAPLAAILPAFLDVFDTGRQARIDPTDHQLLEIQHEVKLIRQSLANRDLNGGGGEFTPTQEDLDTYVELLLGQGLAEEEVYMVVEGFPGLRIASSIRRAREKNST